MNSEIVVGLLSLAGTFCGTMSGMRLTAYRIEQLERKVDKHNNFAERIPVVEEQLKETREQISDIKSRLDDIEK